MSDPISTSTPAVTPELGAESIDSFNAIGTALAQTSTPPFCELSPHAIRSTSQNTSPLTAYTFDTETYYSQINGKNRSKLYMEGKAVPFAAELGGVDISKTTSLGNFDEEKSPLLDIVLSQGWVNRIVQFFAGPVDAETLAHGESIYGNLSFSITLGACDDWSPPRPIHRRRSDSLSTALRELDSTKPHLSQDVMNFPHGKNDDIGQSGKTEAVGIFPGPWATHRLNKKEGITEGKQSEFITSEWALVDYSNNPLPAAPAAMLKSAWLCFRARESDPLNDQPILQASLSVEKLKTFGQVTLGVDPSHEDKVIRIWGEKQENITHARRHSSFTTTLVYQSGHAE